jgi:hypothetical protein
MKRPLVFVLGILALALVLAAPAVAQTEQTASGTVVSSSASQIVIRTGDGRQMTFVADTNTTRPADLQAGAPVTVRYHDMSGTFHAASVSASAAPSTGTTPTGTSAATAPPSATRPAADPTGNDARMQQSATPSQAAPAPTTPAQTTTTAPPPAPRTTERPSTVEDTDTARLPATASPLPLVGLSGLLALAGGLGARFLRRRN